MTTSQKEDLVTKLADPGTSARSHARAKLDIILVKEMTDSLAQLSVDINHAKKIVGTNLTELGGELHRLRQQMDESSKAATSQTAAMVRWSRALFWITTVYAALTAGLLVASVIALLRRVNSGFLT